MAVDPEDSQSILKALHEGTLGIKVGDTFHPLPNYNEGGITTFWRLCEALHLHSGVAVDEDMNPIAYGSITQESFAGHTFTPPLRDVYKH